MRANARSESGSNDNRSHLILTQDGAEDVKEPSN